MAEKNFIVRNGLTVTGGVTIDSDISVGGSLTINGAAVTPGLDSAEIKTLISGGTGITYTEATGVIATDDSAIVHDNLSGFVADEHVAHSTINIVAGDGLTGGGTIDSNVTINVVAGTGLTASADAIAITNTGVVAGSYGSASQVPVFSVNAQGQIDSATSVSVAGVSATAYDSSTGIFTISTADGGSFNTTLHDSADLESRARYAMGVTDAGGDGSLTYNAGTGVYTYTGPSASEVRAHFSAGTGLSLTDGAYSITNTGVSAATYGDSSTIPQITVNAQGQITAVVGASVNIPAGYDATNFDSDFATKTTDDLTEGTTNLYYDSATTVTVARNSVSATDAGGDGSFSYNAGTGVFTYTGPSAAEVRAHFTGGTGIDITTGTISTVDTQIVHDNLSGFVANEHIDHSGVTLTAGTGLSGGGDITASRTFAIDSAEFLANFEASINHDNLTGFVANEHIDHSGVTITAGAGLTGGGDITTSRTINVGAGTGVTVNADNIAIGQSVATTADVTFNSVTTTDGLIVGGNLQVNGTTTTVSSQSIEVTDNMIYMNAGESAGSPTLSIDVGWAANVNDDGSYTHVGMFRDATDNTFKVFGAYSPEPDSGLEINTGHASFALAPFAASTLSGKYLGADSDIDARLSGGTGITYSAGTISTNDGQIVHDNLSGFVANEHIDHSAVSITAGSGLTGGGDITTTRTLNIGQGTGITVSADAISTNDAEIVHDNLSGFVADEHIAHSGVTLTAGVGLSGGGTIAASRTFDIDSAELYAYFNHDGFTGFVADEHVAHSGVTITAGAGLTGGGTIEATRTLNVGQGTGITVGADAISTNDGEIVHDNLSGFVANEHIDHSTVSITAGTGLSGGGTIAASRTINIANTGVTAATYGDSSTIPVITVNAQGQITAVVGAGVNIPAGYGDADVEAYLSGGTGITFSSGVITNAGVTSVNGVTGAVTASNLLTALLTVDGAASGLDADLLDGQQGSYYRIDVYNSAGTLLN